MYDKTNHVKYVHSPPLPPLQLVHLVSGNHHVSVLVLVLEGLEGLHVLRHLLQANLQEHLTL